MKIIKNIKRKKTLKALYHKETDLTMIIDNSDNPIIPVENNSTTYKG